MDKHLIETRALELIELKSMKGLFLAATPVMEDSRFIETLILMVHHDDKGAAGFVINTPVSNLSFYELLEQLKIENPEGVSNHIVFQGGPVEAGNGFVIYEGSMGLRDEMHIADSLFYSRSIESLKRIAEGRGPEYYSICLGRAEWGPGQLEEELRENVWLPVPLESQLVFGEIPENVWANALRKQGISAANFTNVAGHA